jgi:hypothetical protein
VFIPMKKEYLIFGSFGFIPYIYYVIMREIKTKVMKNETIQERKEILMSYGLDVTKVAFGDLTAEEMNDAVNEMISDDYTYQTLLKMAKKRKQNLT